MQHQQQLEGATDDDPRRILFLPHSRSDVYCVDLNLLTLLVGKGVSLDDGVAKLGEQIHTLCSRRLRILVTLRMQCLCS